MKRWLGWLVLAALPAPGLAAGGVTASRLPQADRSVTLVHEVVVDAPLAATWAAVSTAAGWQGWAAKVAWPLPDDVIETSYSANAKIGDQTTIRQQVLMRVSERLLVFQTIKAPAGFRDFDAYARVKHILEVEAVGDTRTRVRLTGTNYADSDAGRRLADFFERGNAQSLESLRNNLSSKAAPITLDPGLAPLGFVVGHCWRGDVPGRVESDTHCFESVWGGKHIRDTHEVATATGTYRGETLYSWNPDLERVDYTYWNSLGNVLRGSMTPNGDQLEFASEARRPTPAVWRRLGTDAYVATSRIGGTARSITFKLID